MCVSRIQSGRRDAQQINKGVRVCLVVCVCYSCDNPDTLYLPLCVCVCSSYPLFVAETDDYAEIVDEEDTYTMPSSK